MKRRYFGFDIIASFPLSDCDFHIANKWRPLLSIVLFAFRDGKLQRKELHSQLLSGIRLSRRILMLLTVIFHISGSPKPQVLCSGGERRCTKCCNIRIPKSKTIPYTERRNTRTVLVHTYSNVNFKF